MSNALEQIKHLVGANGYLENEKDKQPYETPWRGDATGKSALVVFPNTTNQLSEIIKICYDNAIPLVPQGGNTGLVGASVPDQSGKSILMSLSRINQVVGIDPINRTSIVEAGCILAQYKKKLSASQMLFPLKMASEGSAQMGGVIATNAGGTAVLRYGTMRELVLGVEAVLADGTIIDELHGLRKNNTGYNLSQLLIGAEGTLGVITKVCVKIFPQPKQTETAFIGCDSLEEVMQIFQSAQHIAGETLSAFELVPAIGCDLVTQHIPNTRNPLSGDKPWAILIECSTSSSHINLRSLIETLILECKIEEGVIAESEAQRQAIWALREYITEAEKQEHQILAFDISIPISSFPAFITETSTNCEDSSHAPKVVAFGHVGDGNVHFNLLLPKEADSQTYSPELKDIVYQAVQKYKGSFSAEHGVGRDKQDVFKAHTSQERIGVMQKLKDALDKKGIMNPGVMLGG